MRLLVVSVFDPGRRHECDLPLLAPLAPVGDFPTAGAANQFDDLGPKHVEVDLAVCEDLRHQRVVGAVPERQEHVLSRDLLVPKRFTLFLSGLKQTSGLPGEGDLGNSRVLVVDVVRDPDDLLDFEPDIFQITTQALEDLDSDAVPVDDQGKQDVVSADAGMAVVTGLAVCHS